MNRPPFATKTKAQKKWVNKLFGVQVSIAFEHMNGISTVST